MAAPEFIIVGDSSKHSDATTFDKIRTRTVQYLVRLFPPINRSVAFWRKQTEVLSGNIIGEGDLISWISKNERRVNRYIACGGEARICNLNHDFKGVIIWTSPVYGRYSDPSSLFLMEVVDGRLQRGFALLLTRLDGLLGYFLIPIHRSGHPVDVSNCAPHLLSRLLSTPLHFIKSVLHDPDLSIYQEELPSGNAGVPNCGQHDDHCADNVGLRMGATAFESLPPTAAQRVLLLSIGLRLIGIGGFSGPCISLFNGPRRQGMIAGIVLVIEFFSTVGSDDETRIPRRAEGWREL